MRYLFWFKLFKKNPVALLFPVFNLHIDFNIFKDILLNPLIGYSSSLLLELEAPIK